jgi:O-antigen ligase
LLAANTIRTRAHVQSLTTIALVAIGLFAIEGGYRRIGLVNTGQLAGDLVYGHEDAVFLGLALLLVLAQQIFPARGWQRVIGPLFAPVLAFTLLGSERRAGLIGTMVAFLAIALVLLVVHRKAFVRVVVPILLLAAVYLPVFWSNTGILGQPARAIRSLSDPSSRDAASDQYRELEKVNVRLTINSSPLLGVGFGREFLFVVPLPNITNWAFWHYEPHHNILWVWLKTGAIGFTLFWILMGATIMRSAYLLRTLSEPRTRVFALLTVASVFSVLTYSYVDTGLVSGRITLYIGALLGTLAVLDRVYE